MQTIEERRELKNKRQRDYMKKRRQEAHKNLVCPGCDSEFQQHHLKQRYCSDKCQARGYARANPLPTHRRMQYYDTYRTREPWRYALMVVKSRAKKYNMEYDLTHEWAKTRWTGNCELCKLPFVIARSDRSPMSPIDPNKGYTQDNCRFIAWALNAFKGVGTDQEMFMIAQALINQIPPPHLP
jgi:hypothetical protein